MFATLKKIVSIALVLIFISQTFVNVGIGLYYHFNKTYITQQLCENRKDASKNCNGHCYLSKQLKKAEEGEKKQAQNVLKEKQEIISDQNETLPGKYLPVFTSARFISYIYSPTLSDFRNTLVKPPAA